MTRSSILMDDFSCFIILFLDQFLSHSSFSSLNMITLELKFDYTPVIKVYLYMTVSTAR